MSKNQVKVDILRRNQKIRFSSEIIPVQKPSTSTVGEVPPFKIKKPFPVPIKSIPVI